jgi:hypothetical protein
MLVDFQRALADMTASPTLCRTIIADKAMPKGPYDLTTREAARLTAIASSRGMEANCMLYRANRLAPVALNLPKTCDALRGDLNRLISAYWDSAPTTDVHFLIEADRFCRFLKKRDDMPATARAVLDKEHDTVLAKLSVSRTMVAGLSAQASPVRGHRG